jgi:hypothetical protein
MDYFIDTFLFCLYIYYYFGKLKILFHILFLLMIGSSTEVPQFGVLCVYSCGIKTAVVFTSVPDTVIESKGQFGSIEALLLHYYKDEVLERGTIW